MALSFHPSRAGSSVDAVQRRAERIRLREERRKELELKRALTAFVKGR